jgi:transposase-like protein
MKKHSPFRYFKTSPEVIRLAVMVYVRFPLSLRNVELEKHGWLVGLEGGAVVRGAARKEAWRVLRTT